MLKYNILLERNHMAFKAVLMMKLIYFVLRLKISCYLLNWHMMQYDTRKKKLAPILNDNYSGLSSLCLPFIRIFFVYDIDDSNYKNVRYIFFLYLIDRYFSLCMFFKFHIWIDSCLDNCLRAILYLFILNICWSYSSRILNVFSLLTIAASFRTIKIKSFVNLCA